MEKQRSHNQFLIVSAKPTPAFLRYDAFTKTQEQEEEERQQQRDEFLQELRRSLKNLLQPVY